MISEKLVFQVLCHENQDLKDLDKTSPASRAQDFTRRSLSGSSKKRVILVKWAPPYILLPRDLTWLALVPSLLGTCFLKL